MSWFMIIYLSPNYLDPQVEFYIPFMPFPQKVQKVVIATLTIFVTMAS